MAQLAAKRTSPACRASRDDSMPAGALGALPSHPEMTSEIVNRTMPASSLRFPNHSVAKALHLADNGRDERIEPVVDGIRANHRQIDDIRHEPEEGDRGRVAVDQPRRLEQIRNTDLVGRQAIPYRISDIRSVQPDQRSRRRVGAHRIDHDHTVRIRYQTEKRQSERAAVLDADARRGAIVALDSGDRGGAKPIIGEQDVAQSEDENANVLCCRLWRGLAAHEASAFRLGTNL